MKVIAIQTFKPNVLVLGHSFVGGALYCLLVFVGVELFLPELLYAHRDDGLISFSHALHFFKYGFYGVSPSGGLVEGVSTPALAIFHLIAAGLFKATYTSYNDIMGPVSLIAFGSVLFWLASNNKPKHYGYLFVGLAAVVSVAALKNLSWHLGGLENHLSNFFIPVSVLAFYNYVKTGKMPLTNGLLVGFAILTRAEGIMYILPVSALAVFFRYYGQRNQFSWLQVGRLLLVVMALPMLVHLIRFLYFGHFFPDSALAQNISVSDNLSKVLHFNKVYLFEAYDLSVTNLKENYGFLILPLVVMVLGGYSVFLKTKAQAFIFLSIVLVWVLYFVQPFIFFATRLDPTRYVSPVFQLVLLGFAFFVAFVTKHNLKKPSLSLVFSVSMVLILWVGYRSVTPAEKLCCPQDAFSFTLKKFRWFAQNHQVLRPTVSNPDLGLISKPKEFNILDMGLLGSPEMGRLNQNKTLYNFYLFTIRKPDIAEVHQVWRNRDVVVFSNPDLFANYQAEFFSKPEWYFVSTQAVKGKINFNTGFLRNKAILKNSKSAERLFLNKLQKSIESNRIHQFPELVSAEFNQVIAKRQKGVEACYIANQVFRFVPELRENKLLQPTLQIFEKYQQHDMGFGKVLLTSFKDKNWDKKMQQITEALWFDYHFGVSNPADLNNSLAKPTHLSNGQLYKGKHAWIWRSPAAEAPQIKAFELSFVISDQHPQAQLRGKQATWVLKPEMVRAKPLGDYNLYLFPTPATASQFKLSIIQ